MNQQSPREMKTFRILRLSALVLLSTTLAGQAGDETAVWLAKDAEAAQGGIFLPDNTGKFEFALADAAGVSIGEGPGEGEDTKSLVFSGTQAAPLKTKTPFPAVVTKLVLSVRVKSAEETGIEDGTILRYGTQWEIRYDTKKGGYSFVIWHDKNIYTTVFVPVSRGAWAELKIEATEEAVTLSADGKEVHALPKGAFHAETNPSALILGAAASKQSSRPFYGSVADLRITVQ